MHSETRITVVDTIVDQLAGDIVSGRLPAASRLPTLKDLSARFDVTIATMQRVIARLEAMNLVAGRKGSGVTVLDTDVTGGPGLLPVLIRDALAHPTSAATAIADWMELQRWVAKGLFQKLLDNWNPGLAAELGLILNPLKALVANDAKSVASSDLAFETDFRMIRHLIQATGQSAALAILNVLQQAHSVNPLLKRAVYLDPRRTVLIWDAMLDAMESPDALRKLLVNLDDILETHGQLIIETFTDLCRTNAEGVANGH